MAALALETAKLGNSGRIVIAAVKTYIGGQFVIETINCWRIYAMVDDPCKIGDEKGRCLQREIGRRKKEEDG